MSDALLLRPMAQRLQKHPEVSPGYAFHATG